MKLRNKKTGEVFDAIIREKGGGGSYSLIVCDIKSYEQSKSTLDESPMAYKSAENILNNISPTAKVIKTIRPIYNFKACDSNDRRR